MNIENFSHYQQESRKTWGLHFTQICTELDLTLEEVAAANLEKPLSRLERNQLRGDGDER
jgi:hypothetical protein